MKVLAFATGASTAGFAGAVYSSYVGYIVPSNFVLLTAIMILAAVVLGGMSNMKGAMLGAVVIVFLPELFRGFDQARFLAFGAILVVTMIVRPAGLFPLRPRVYPLAGVGEAAATPTFLEGARGGTGALVSRHAEQPETRPPLLTCSGLSKRFGGLVAVSAIDLQIQEGSIFAVIGPNGAGKSTLFNLISGSIRPDAGEVRFGGHSIQGLKPHQIARLGLARTFQLIRLFPAVTVTENVMVGADLRAESNAFAVAARLPRASRDERHSLACAEAALAFCGIRHLAGAAAGTLSYGDQRRVEIARALASSPRLVLLDEPAAGMNPTERRELGQLIRKIRARSITVVIVEHDIKLIMDIADEILVLQSGVMISKGTPDEVRADPRVIEAYLGKPPAERTEVPPTARVAQAEANDEVTSALSVTGLRVAHGPIEAVHGIDFEVGQGEIVSIIGANGAGKSSTLLAVSGVIPARSGSVTFLGKRIDGMPAHAITAARMAHVPEGRRIFPRMSVWENLAMGTYASGRPPDSEDLDRVFALFPILKTRLDQLGGTMSGGEQQMLAMARAIVSRPQLLLLDEPSMGLAPQFVDLVFELIKDINRSGVSVLLIEQNAEMALLTATRAYVLESGQIRLSGSSAAMLNNKEIQAAYLGG